MATVGDVTTHISTNFKTTLQGFILAAVAIGSIIQGLGITTWHEVLTLPHILAILAGASPAIIGLLQKDAGVQLAQTPSGKVAVVDSHETPNDPANIPVEPK